MSKRINMPVDERICLDCKVIMTTIFLMHNNVLITFTLCGRQKICVVRVGYQWINTPSPRMSPYEPVKGGRKKEVEQEEELSGGSTG